MEPDRTYSGSGSVRTLQKAPHLAQWRELVSGLRMNVERLRDVPRLPVLEEEPE